MRSALLTILVACWAGLFLSGCTEADPGVHQSSPGQTIRRGNVEDPASLDPLLAEDIHSFSILLDLYEGLVAEDAAGKLIPGVAESWTVSDDGLLYSFKLRPNARWSNGDSVTANDFVRGLRRASAPAAHSAYASFLDPIENFREAKSGSMPIDDLGVEAVDDYTIRIKLREPSAYFLSLLAMPVAFPIHSNESNPARFKDPGQFVGNGAYNLFEWRIGNPIKLQRNDQYWDSDAVKTEYIEYIATVNELAEYNMYRAGELDISGVIPSTLVQQARTEFNDEVRIAPSMALYYLAFDLTEAPLNDRRLRQALSMAIDREQLVNILGRGEEPAYAIVPPGVANYKSAEYEWATGNATDIKKEARILYAEAGFGPEKPLTIKYVYDAGGIHENVALAIGAMWKDTLGVDVEFDKREWKYFLDTRDNRDEWQVMRFSWFGDYNDASTFLNIFESNDMQNLPRYSNAIYDRLLQSASVAVDANHRSELMSKAESVLLNDFPIAPLYFFVSKHLVKPNIMGFENNVLDRHPSKYLYITD